MKTKAPLKILLCFNPFQERGHPASFHTYWIKRTHMFFYPAMKDTAFEFSALLNEEQKLFWAQNYPDSYALIKHFITFSPKQTRIFGDEYGATQKWFVGDYTPAQLKTIRDHVSATAGRDYTPDMCIVFYHRAPYVTATYPAAKIVTFYEGGFSRMPYMPTWRFDRTGCVQNADTQELAALKGVACADKAFQIMEKFRAIIGNAISSCNPFTADAEDWRKKYKKLVLLPLQLSGRPAFDCVCDFESQIHYLSSVMEKVPPSIGVVVTEHPNYPQITTELYQDMTKRYPNFIYKSSFLKVENSSFFLTPLVDAVITVSSSVIWHAMLEGKLACVLGDSDSAPMADCHSMEELIPLLESKKPNATRFYAILYNLLTRYWIPETQMKDPTFVKPYIESIYSNGKTTILSDEELLVLATQTASRFKLSKRDLAQMVEQVQMPPFVSECLSKPGRIDS